MANTTKVTHPDGTVSKRTSQNRTYTHAVVMSQTRESLIADALAYAAKFDELAAADLAAVDGEITTESRDWSGGLTYYSLYVGGEYAAAHVSDQPRPSDDDLRAKLRKGAASQSARADEYRARAAKLADSPTVVYGVLRWSSRADLAHKAATGEFGGLVRDGVAVYVQPVD